MVYLAMQFTVESLNMLMQLDAFEDSAPLNMNRMLESELQPFFQITKPASEWYKILHYERAVEKAT